MTCSTAPEFTEGGQYSLLWTLLTCEYQEGQESLANNAHARGHLHWAMQNTDIVYCIVGNFCTFRIKPRDTKTETVKL